MAFSESFLEELKDRSDIAEVVSGYVRLTKKTGSNQFGLCPFHSEKTPSFSVNTEHQIYHCFGCGKGGGSIGFIMEIENLSYADAVRFLANRAGLEVPEDRQDPAAGQRARMLELNREAARFFHAQLQTPAGAAARAYIAKRGLSDAMVTAFGLGCAPDSWNALTDAMNARGYTRAELVTAGLARVGKTDSVYDYFRNRLMFPVIDVRGSVIGFSGRILGDGEPKYLNSPDTLVYSKSRSLFGLNLAKKTKAGYLLLAEGNIDVVSLHQAGFDAAVASLGTSLTAEQARLMARYTKEIVIAYDADTAGVKAAGRAIGILQQLEMKVRVLRIPSGKDPDEFIRSEGPEAFRQLIAGGGNQVEYRLDFAAERFDLNTDDGRVGWLKEAIDILATLPGAVEREIYALRVAERAGVTADAVLTEAERLRKKKTRAARREEEREQLRPVRSVQPADRSVRYDDVKSAVAEQGAVRLLCHYPELWRRTDLKGSEFSSPELGRLFDLVVERGREGKSIDPDLLGERLTPEEVRLLVNLMGQQGMSLAAAENAMVDYTKRIRGRFDREQVSAEGADDEALRRYVEKLKKTKGNGDRNGN